MVPNDNKGHQPFVIKQNRENENIFLLILGFSFIINESIVIKKLLSDINRIYRVTTIYLCFKYYIIFAFYKLKQHQEMFQGFITSQGLQQLNNYHYKSGGYTWLDLKMNHFWEATVKLIPTWMAPNLITFIGWLFVIASYVNMLIYDYTFQKDIPSYCFFFAALCLFIYSTLDAVDGKQARRTKSSSPLGQLFDHGCDSFSMTFFILAICQACKLPSHDVFLLFIGSQACFWTSNWMEYNTGVLTTKVGQFGVTEAEFSCILIHLITGVFGQNFWQIRLNQILFFLPEQIGNIFIGSAFVYGFATGMFLMCAYVYFKTIWQCKGNRFKIMCEYLCLYLIIAMQYVWMNLSIYDHYNGLILVNFGILVSLLVCKMIICSVTKMKFQYFHNQLIVFLIATILMVGFDLQQNKNGMIITFWLCFLINLVSILEFLYLTINQITKFLGIYCFSLEKRKTPHLGLADKNL